MKRLQTLALISLLGVSAQAQTVPKEATQVFDQYVALEANFDPAVADLYADDAVIKNTRRFPDGTSRAMSLPAPTYKDLIRKSMATAKTRGDTNKYSSIKTNVEAGKVRVTATRYSDLKKHSSPISLLLAQRAGRWLIVEELSESTAIAVDLTRPIRELKLLDGRTLGNVFVMSVGENHLAARWRGGQGNISYDLLPEEYREAAIKMRTPKPAAGAPGAAPTKANAAPKKE
jgi:hypothetical protein